MEMKPEDYKRYLEKWGSPRPKQGRYAPHGQFFQCATDEQVRILEEAGWTDSPLKFDPPYKPEKAKWVEKWDDVSVHGEKTNAQAEDQAVVASAERRKPGPKPKVAA